MHILKPVTIVYRALLADFLLWSSYASQSLFLNLKGNSADQQSAAAFLGWIMCPSSSEGRAYVVTEILRAAQEWHYMCDERMTVGNQLFKRSGDTRRFFDLNGTDSFSLSLCDLCGCPVHWNGDRVNGGPHHVSDSSTLHNLVAWLLNLCSLGSELRLLHLKGEKFQASSILCGYFEVLISQK